MTHRIQETLPSVVDLRDGTLTGVARKLHDFQGMAYSKLCLHVILSRLTDGRPRIEAVPQLKPGT
jgi:hypothetical protein